MPRGVLITIAFASICTAAWADESLTIVDDFVAPGLRGASLCLPENQTARITTSRDARSPDDVAWDDLRTHYDRKHGCKFSAGEPLASADVSVGAIQNLVDRFEFLKQDGSYVNAGLHRYFELGSGAMPVDIALNATTFDAREHDSATDQLQRRVQIRAGHYALFASRDHEIITTRTSLSLETLKFSRRPDEYVAAWELQLRLRDETNAYADIEYQWGGDRSIDYRVRLHDTIELTRWVSRKVPSVGARVELVPGAGVAWSDGRFRWLPFSLSLRAQYDLGRFMMVYGGYEYSYQPRSPGYIAGGNSQLQIGVYANLNFRPDSP
jgi:hypothetical protein